MSVLLMILKIIGIVLILILALLVLLVAGLLFAPIIYRVKGSYHDTPDLKVSLYGLGYLFGIGGILSENDTRIYVRVLGIRKFLNFVNKETDSANTKQYDSSNDTISEVAYQIDETNSERPYDENFSETNTDQMMEADESAGFENKARKPICRKILLWYGKIKEIYHTIVHAIRNIHNTINKLQRLMNDEGNKRAFTTIRLALWKLIKAIVPHRLKLTLEYSTGSPDTTAQILGVLAMFPMGYQNGWNVFPDFTAENAYVDADFDVKGRIFGFWLLKWIFGLVLDKDCQKLYNTFKKMKA